MSESKTPKVLNPPKRIWLNFGEIEEDVDFSDLRDGESITWCEGAQDDADVEYMLASDLAAALVKTAELETEVEVLAGKAARIYERDALAARVAEALSAVHDVLEAAYHRCYPECCGRPGMECCGSPIQTWSKDDEHIMNTLGPVEKSLRAALSREEKS